MKRARGLITCRAALVAFLLVTVALAARAEAPSFIAYQGKLTESNGTPVANRTDYSVTFVIYLTATGGSPIVTIPVNNITITNGVFSTLIPIDASTLQNNSELYLAVFYDGNEFTPRQRLVSAPYALAVAADSVGTAEIIDSSITGDKIMAGVLVSTHVKNGSLLGDDIAPGVLASTHIAPGQLSLIVAGGIEDGSISGNKIFEGVLVSTHVKNGSLLGDDIAPGVLVSTHIKNGSLLGDDVAPGVLVSTHIKSGSIEIGDIKSADFDSHFVTTDTAQPINGIKTIGSDWVNTVFPWSDNEVSDTLTIGAASMVTLSALEAGTLPPDVIASSVAVNAVNTAQISNNAVTADKLDPGVKTALATLDVQTLVNNGVLVLIRKETNGNLCESLIVNSIETCGVDDFGYMFKVPRSAP